MKRLFIMVAAMCLGLGAVGCQKHESASDKAGEMAEDAGEMAEDAGEMVEDAGESVMDAAEEVGDEIDREVSY